MKKKNVIIAVLIVIALIACVLIFARFGSGGETDGTTAPVGSTAGEPDDISTAEESSSPDATGEVTDENTTENTTDEATDTTAEVTTEEVTTEEVTTEEVTTEEATTEEVTTEEVTTEEVTTEEVTTEPPHVHTPAVDAAVNATCTADGKTEGSHCSECGEVLVAQETVKAKGHSLTVDKGYSATCTAEGLSDGKHCTVCGTVETAQKPIPAKGHSLTVDKGYSATCTADGLTDGKHCTVCGTVETAQKPIAAKGHTAVKDAAVAPTVSDTGLTEGSHCSVCGHVIVEQQIVPATGRIIYYENFDSCGISYTNSTVMHYLGWKMLYPSDGAYSGHTANYKIVFREGTKVLQVTNNVSGAKDSYVLVLGDELMGKYHESNYTYQYDVIYDSSSDVKRYFALVSEYDGMYYNSFHFRNGGYGNNQCHAWGSWITYDAPGVNYAANTNSYSIANKLLGVNYSESKNAFKGISVSIRYVVDWENGNKIYMRVNNEGYPGSGIWTLISSGRALESYDPFEGGAAIVLKIGGAQDGYIDNIIIWEGTGDEPADKSAPLLTSDMTVCSGHTFRGEGSCIDPNECIYCGEKGENNQDHTFVTAEGGKDAMCSVCYCYKSSLESGWAIPQTPVYSGGKLASGVYIAGHGIAPDFSTKTDSPMILVSQTNADQFRAYCELMEQCGSEQIYTFSQDGNIYAQYESGDAFIYAYYTDSVGETRIIYDEHSTLSLAEFGYEREKQAGETTVLYQYGVPMNEKGSGINDSDRRINCGMMYVIKLADNSVIVLDGGGHQQFDTAQIDGFMKFLRDVTGTPAGEKVKIAGWHISHCHSDHMAGFCLFVKKYYKELDFDRIFFNFPSVNSENSIISNIRGNYSKVLTYIEKYLDADVEYLKIHTGQSFNLGEVKIGVIYTHEDMVNPKTGKTEVPTGDYNESCSVLKIEFDGKSFMFLGDINRNAMKIIIANNSEETLKSDIVQLAHHVINNLTELYNIIQAPVLLIPQSPKGCTNGTTRKKAYESAMKYMKDDMYFYASEETVGLQVIDGKITKVFTAPVHGGYYGSWSW